MKLEKGRTTSYELAFSVFCFMQGTMLRSGFIIGVTKSDSWAMALTGFVVTLPIVLIYAALLRRFPEKSLIEINDIIFGKVLGKVFSVLYLFFFLSLAALNTRDLGNFAVGYMMPETPMPAIILLFLLGCVYTIHKGFENLMRLSVFFCIATVVAVALNTVLILQDVQPGALLPLFRLPPMTYVQGTLTVTAVPMGEILAFTMVAPMLGKKKKAGSPLLLGLTLSAVFMVFVLIRDIITLGPLVSIVSLPSFESVRYLSLADVLTRLESIYAVIIGFLFLFKVSVLLYAFILGLGQILNVKSYPPLAIICTALVYLYSLFVFDSVMENMDWGATAAPFFSLTFEFLLPAVSLLVACIRRVKSPREVSA
jgi:spore germination protein KB